MFIFVPNEKIKEMKTQGTKFEVGNIYEMRLVGDNDLRPHFICTKRTAKTVTFESKTGNEKFTKRINKCTEGHDRIVHGSYSMAPYIKSNKIVG